MGFEALCTVQLDFAGTVGHGFRVYSAINLRKIPSGMFDGNTFVVLKDFRGHVKKVKDIEWN